MANVHDVAQYILAKRGPMTTMKLQKLVYYSQVWNVVWNDDALFPEPIQAWDNGPVVRELWLSTKGQFRVAGVNGNPDALSASQKTTVDQILEFYGDKDAQWLSDLTHMEAPWIEARSRAQSEEISLERISEYYSTLSATNQARG